MLSRLFIVLLFSACTLSIFPVAAEASIDLIKVSNAINGDVSSYAFWGRWGGIVGGGLVGGFIYWYLRTYRQGNELVARKLAWTAAICFGITCSTAITTKSLGSPYLNQCIWDEMILTTENNQFVVGRFTPAGAPEEYSVQDREKLAYTCLQARDELPLPIGRVYKFLAGREHLCNQWSNCPFPKYELLLTPMIETGFWAWLLTFFVSIPLVRWLRNRG